MTLQPAAPVSLEQVCPVQFRGVPVADAMAALSAQLGVPFVVDAAVQPSVISREVRLSAGHLTGRQAFRWLARLAGAEAVLVDGTFLVVPAANLPGVWRSRTGSSAQDGNWRAALSRRADITWQDTPLTRVAADIAAGFGIDVIFHAELLEESPLVELHMPGAGIEAVAQELAKQLKAVAEPLDGALWIHPRAATATSPASAPASRPARMESPASAVRAAPIDAPVTLDRSVQSWDQFRQRLSAATGLDILIRGERPYPSFEAAGPAADVLEGGRLLGFWSWSYRPGISDRGGRIEVDLQPSGVPPSE